VNSRPPEPRLAHNGLYEVQSPQVVGRATLGALARRIGASQVYQGPLATLSAHARASRGVSEGSEDEHRRAPAPHRVAGDHQRERSPTHCDKGAGSRIGGA
jgi:hypothetical protein